MPSILGYTGSIGLAWSTGDLAFTCLQPEIGTVTKGVAQWKSQCLPCTSTRDNL